MVHAKRSLRTTLFFETFSLLAITVLLTTIAAFFLARHELILRAFLQLQSAAQSRENLLESTISRQREQMAILGHDPSLASLPSITHLIGFRTLLRLDSGGMIAHITERTDGIDLDSSFVQESSKGSRTLFRPMFSHGNWTAYAIATPQVDAGGKRRGTLIAIFDPTELMVRILGTDYMGSSAEVLLVLSQSGTLTLLHTDSHGGAVPVRTGSATERAFIQEALMAQEGTADSVDYAGIPVLAAYRTMPSIGWTVIVQMDRYAVVAPIVRLAINLIAIGLMLVGLLSLSMFFLARRIVSPLEELARKLNNLETRRWSFRKSIFTGNELEVVDDAAADLTARLRCSYDHLEDIVHERTKKLREQTAQDAAILENVEYGLLMTDAEAKIVYINHAGELLLGRSVGQMIGQDAVRTLQISDKNGTPLPEDHHPIRVVLRSRQRFNPMTDPEYSLLKADGKRTALFVRATPILRGARCLGVVAVLRDTTEERRIDHMKSEFISLVSHQLRTPLSSMRWYLEMLLAQDAEKLTDSQRREYMVEVATSNARMVHMVNALLNVSRLELQKMQLTPQAIELTSLLQEIGDSFKLELKRRKMALTIERGGDIPAVHSDHGLLQLILENLISNAVKYGLEGTSIHIKIDVDRSVNLAILRISNQGIGIPENQQSQIFQKMFRGTNARSTDTDGNGLGLFVSHVAAETIGATLSFQSTENGETTFTVSLPLAPPHSGPPEADHLSPHGERNPRK